mmetsp:Transcript_61161/g.90752  ORF Transcript_61161/g.90752 Transcript_61161/m.90752 type:complete len:276 (-) Transcript_61161:170-997(-)
MKERMEEEEHLVDIPFQLPLSTANAISNVGTDLSCIRCRCLPHHPVIPPCGHLVCKSCIAVQHDGDFGNVHSCPECDTPVWNYKSLESCTLLSSIVTKLRLMLSHDGVNYEANDLINDDPSLQNVSTLVCLPCSTSSNNHQISINNIIHSTIKCEGCGLLPITNHAFTCVHCPHYNLCLHCYNRQVYTKSFGLFERYDDGHAHVMIRRRKPRSSSSSSSYQRNIAMDVNVSSKEYILIFLFQLIISFMGGGWQLMLDDDDVDDEDELEDDESIAM